MSYNLTLILSCLISAVAIQGYPVIKSSPVPPGHLQYINFSDYEPFLSKVSNFKQFLSKTEKTNKKRPRVSIITSVYKGDKFIKNFLKDITRQTIFNQCELILINANSPGNEESVIKKYRAKFPNIRYLKLPYDPGLYGVWNLAIKMALSDLITNSNLDDRRATNSLEIHAQALEKNPDIDLVYAPYYATKTPNQTFKKHDTIYLIDFDEFSPERMVSCLPGIQPMWRKSMHEKYGLFNPWFTSAGDWEMWLRAVDGGAKFKKIKQILGLYYENPRGLSTENTHERIKCRQIEVAVTNYFYNHLWSE